MCTCAFVVWNIGWITTYARGNGEKDIRLNGIDKMGLDIYFNFSEREKEREKKDKHHIWWNVFIYNCRWLGGKYAITKHTHTQTNEYASVFCMVSDDTIRHNWPRHLLCGSFPSNEMLRWNLHPLKPYAPFLCPVLFFARHSNYSTIYLAEPFAVSHKMNECLTFSESHCQALSYMAHVGRFIYPFYCHAICYCLTI